MLLAGCLGVAAATAAQDPLPQDEALRQIYNNYDAKTKTAQWVCTDAQKKSQEIHEGWACDQENAAVSIAALLMAEVQESGTTRVYVAASAKPTNSPGGYECHMCAPAIGVGVFAGRGEHWILESANAAVGFYGSWGGPPSVDLVKAGPEKHGLILWAGYAGQGYSSSNKVLVVPLDKSVSEVWRIDDEKDNYGAYDPTGKFGPRIRYRSWAAFRFALSQDRSGHLREFFDIEVSSRGRDEEGPAISLRSENWTETYRFNDGKYRLLSHQDFVEVKKPQAKPVK